MCYTIKRHHLFKRRENFKRFFENLHKLQKEKTTFKICLVQMIYEKNIRTVPFIFFRQSGQLSRAAAQEKQVTK